MIYIWGDLHAILGVLRGMLLGSAIFSTLVVARIVKTRERFMGIGQVLTMPMFCASNAIYLDLMPLLLRINISYCTASSFLAAVVHGYGMNFTVLLVSAASQRQRCFSGENIHAYGGARARIAWD